MCPPPLPQGMRRRATRNQTVKKLAVPPRFPADRLSSAPDALVSDCLALFARPAVSAGGTSYSGLRHRQQFLQTFLLRCNFVEHRFGRPPHLRGGVDSGFVFWVNSLFQKKFAAPRGICVRRANLRGLPSVCFISEKRDFAQAPAQAPAELFFSSKMVR